MKKSELKSKEKANKNSTTKKKVEKNIDKLRSIVYNMSCVTGNEIQIIK